MAKRINGLKISKKGMDSIFQQGTVARSIGPWTLLLLAVLSCSPWFPTMAQNCSTLLELIAAYRPINFLWMPMLESTSL